MSDAWDADDFEPPPGTGAAGGDAPKIPIAKLDKWAGEDEDDDVKDAWDKSDSDSDSGEEDPDRPKAVQRKKKKKLAEIIAEKEAAKAAQQAARAAEEAAKRQLNTPEAKMVEKMRLKKMEETSNLQLAQEMMGLKVGSIDAMVPVEKADFDQLDKAVVNKISMYAESPHFPDFVENLIKNMCLDLNATTLKKIKMNVEALHAAKLKDERAKAKKPNAKKGGTIRMDTAKDMFSGGADYDELDDFM
ncbi:eukaryotic translation initiation factor 3 subunit J-like [Tigriopus californicus]|uniref:eukaryotic translation initiation factor 3 subunit J-like n=1 Tax=Tigriopus californicus TaxID=6832 RepID=UPI0027DA7416|nr:eukaryotic translation initiation factor 3 subunit J-like [Tigriopus californicus]